MSFADLGFEMVSNGEMWTWTVLSLHLITIILAEYNGTGTSWKRVLTQNDRSFTSPSAQIQKSSVRECASYCHAVPGSLSLTFNDNNNVCKCYEVDYQFGGSYEPDIGSVFMTSNYTVTSTASPASCEELYSAGNSINGVYSITPEPGTTFDVFCDLANGGWTVVQNRFDGSVNFTRSWHEYSIGFGSLSGEFWMGLEKLHLLTKTPKEVYFHLQKIDDTWLYLHYTTFFVESNVTNYRLNVSNNVPGGGVNGESFMYNNGQEFSTYDRDNEHDCAKIRFGGWWYKFCVFLNLNGKYGLYDTAAGMTEYHGGGGYKKLKSTIMKIK